MFRGVVSRTGEVGALSNDFLHDLRLAGSSALVRGIVSETERDALSIDPRPDLIEDSGAWCDLLVRAYLVDGRDPGGLFQALHGLRCCGMRLMPDPRVGLRLARDDQTDLGEDEYQAIRARYLVPHAAQLRDLLRRVRR